MKAIFALLSTSLLIVGGLTLGSSEGNAQGHASPATLKAQKAAQGSDAAAEQPSDAEIIAAQLPSYPLDTCVISGEGLGEMGGALDLVVEGRLIRVCCKGCIKGVKKDSAAAIAAIDAAVIKAQKASYPLDTCLISGEALGSMGEPIDIVSGTRLARVCCKGCVRGFKKAPAKYMDQVNEALIAQQLKTYPLETCPISGESLGSMGDSINHLYGTRLVRLCCKMCVRSFTKEPGKTLAMIDKAAKKKRGA